MTGLSILTADDSALARTALQGVLRQMGHEPLVAKDGEEAWALFREERPAVVISDLMMPRVDGMELCRLIRDEDLRPYTYFMMLTALEDRDEALRGMRAGADDYLTKPLDRQELQRRLIVASRVTKLHQRLAAEQEAVRHLNAELHQEARFDPLTRTGNRLLMRENLTSLAARVQRYGHKTSLALIDIDNFKQLNDSAGHLAGDEVLKQVSGELKRQARDGDMVYRYGGEEFLVVLEDQDLDGG
ncbi:MAG TPA: diguanylate cyclase, partial [Thermoleophilaceae bacterium]|nr:diguanylate cyclase [Thermoleophilaceae bacterium]